MTLSKLPDASGSLDMLFQTGSDGRLDRMPTGIPGLDHLLDGGLVRGNSLLVEGSPGSGKSKASK